MYEKAITIFKRDTYIDQLSKGTVMNKTELVAAMAKDASINKNQAKAAFDSMVSHIMSELQSGGSVVLPGFGTFEVRNRAARDGHNPKLATNSH